MLADQVEVQAEKIIELERVLDRKKDELKRLEQNLHQVRNYLFTKPRKIMYQV